MFGQSKDFSKRKSYVLPLIFLFCLKSFGTTGVFVITPTRIVAGTDRLSLRPANDGTFTKKGIATKIALLKGRFIVACIGLESFKGGPSPERQVLLYDFPRWVEAVESQVAPDTSTLQLVTIVENESSKTFTETIPIEIFMKNGTIKYADAWKKFLVQYVVAGFDSGVATVIEVNYEFDWERNRLIGPTRNVQLPRGNINTALYSVGQHSQIEQIADPDTYGYKRMAILAPIAFKKLMASQQTSRQEAVNAIRALIAVEAEIDPSEVGSGATVVVLPIVGKGTVSQYQTTLTLPKAKGQTHKKNADRAATQP